MAKLLGHKEQTAAAKFPDRLLRLEQSIANIPPIQDFKINPDSPDLKGELRRYKAILVAYVVRYRPVLKRYEMYRDDLLRQIDGLERLARETDDDKRRESLRCSVLLTQQNLAFVEGRIGAMREQKETIEQSIRIVDDMNQQQRLGEVVKLQLKLREIEKALH